MSKESEEVLPPAETGIFNVSFGRNNLSKFIWKTEGRN